MIPSTLTNRYSGLITGGLGLPASKGLLTMDLLVFSNGIERIVGGNGSGGGAQYVRPPHSANFRAQQSTPFYYTPRNQGLSKGVQITVKMNGKETSQEFVIMDGQSKPDIKVINIFDKTNHEILDTIKDIKVKFK